MPSARFITHARSLEELRSSFLSDIHQRLARLDLEANYERRVRQSAAIARGKIELESLLTFWQEVELKGASSRLSAAARANQKDSL